MKIADLVRTYRLLNDPEAPSWNVKFAGIVAAGILAVALVGSVAWDAQNGGSTTPAAAQMHTGYVGTDLPHAEDGAALPLTPEEALEKWRAEHPEATIVSQEPVYVDGRLVGYSIQYLP